MSILSEHRVRLPGVRHPVGKQETVLGREHIIYQGAHRRIVDLFLARHGPEHLRETKILRLTMTSVTATQKRNSARSKAKACLATNFKQGGGYTYGMGSMLICTWSPLVMTVCYLIPLSWAI